MLLRAFTGCCLAAALLGAPAALAASTPMRNSTADIRLASMGCGLGFSRDASGMCIDRFEWVRHCPPNFFPISFPNGNGYRCVPSSWLRAPGWFGDLL